MGSNAWQLKLQFLSETFLIVISAVALAVILSIILLPAISKLLEIPLAFDILRNPSVLLFLFTVTMAVTLLAGFYPSVVLSGFNPIHALKSKLAAKNTKGNFPASWPCCIPVYHRAGADHRNIDHCKTNELFHQCLIGV